MLSEYHFKIKYIKGIDNTKANTLSQQAKLQRTKKLSRAILKLHKDGKIRYNHPKLVATQEYKALKSDWEQRINKVQSEDKSSNNYTNQETTYIPKDIVEEFIKKFYKNPIQGHNRIITLIARL